MCEGERCEGVVGVLVLGARAPGRGWMVRFCVPEWWGFWWERWVRRELGTRDWRAGRWLRWIWMCKGVMS